MSKARRMAGFVLPAVILAGGLSGCQTTTATATVKQDIDYTVVDSLPEERALDYLRRLHVTMNRLDAAMDLNYCAYSRDGITGYDLVRRGRNRSTNTPFSHWLITQVVAEGNTAGSLYRIEITAPNQARCYALLTKDGIPEQTALDAVNKAVTALTSLGIRRGH